MLLGYSESGVIMNKKVLVAIIAVLLVVSIIMSILIINNINSQKDNFNDYTESVEEYQEQQNDYIVSRDDSSEGVTVENDSSEEVTAEDNTERTEYTEESSESNDSSNLEESNYSNDDSSEDTQEGVSEPENNEENSYNTENSDMEESISLFKSEYDLFDGDYITAIIPYNDEYDTEMKDYNENIDHYYIAKDDNVTVGFFKENDILNTTILEYNSNLNVGEISFWFEDYYESDSGVDINGVRLKGTQYCSGEYYDMIVKLVKSYCDSINKELSEIFIMNCQTEYEDSKYSKFIITAIINPMNTSIDIDLLNGKILANENTSDDNINAISIVGEEYLIDESHKDKIMSTIANYCTSNNIEYSEIVISGYNAEENAYDVTIEPSGNRFNLKVNN